MRESTISERLKYLMDCYNLKQSDILKMTEPFQKKYKIKIGRNDLSQYISGKVNPGSKKLAILGLALNVNEAWLMGFDVPMKKDDSKLDEQLLNKIETLTSEQKKAILNIIDTMN